MKTRAGIATIVLSGLLGFGQMSNAQDCDCQTYSNSGIHTPSAGGLLGHGALAAHREQSRQWRAEAAQQAQLIAERNAAWPKPFACWDRQAYHNQWAAFYDAGWISHCTLGEQHFDLETGKLNPLGERKVASVMQKVPGDHRALYLISAGDSNANEKRLNEVRSLVNKWYGDNTVVVMTTESNTRPMSGRRIEAVNQMYMEQTPPPVINVGTQQGISSATGGN